MILSDTESSSGLFPAEQIRADGGAPESDYAELGRHGYSILGRLTRHGMVWFVKSLDGSHRNLSECVARLRKEYEIMLRLNHPGIARAVWFDNDPAIGPAILMELIEGEPLDRFVAHADRASRRAVAVRLLEAMAYMHSQGVCHLDLKPENIMICGRGADAAVKIIDFGMSDYRGSAVLKAVGGNRRYGAPEQFAEGYHSDARADVWSLGRLIAEMRPGLTLRMLARRAMTVSCDRRPADAGQLLRMYYDMRRRLKMSEMVGMAVAVVAALIGVAVWLMPVDSPQTTVADELADTVAVGSRMVVVHDTILPRVDVVTPVDPYKAEHDAIVERINDHMRVVTDSLETVLTNDSLPRKYRSSYIGEFGAKLSDYINAEFEPLRRRCGLEYIRSREPGWATMYDDGLMESQRRITDLLSDFNSECPI
ncbi:MAG: protein kinase [Muribaculum sp.]|nr:protein kinase [Muribaculum sp.]